MRFPNCNGFTLACGLVITVFLEDRVTLTGTFLGEVHDRRRRRRFIDFHEFILLQLTCPFCEKGAPEIPRGTFVAINVEEIQFIVPGHCCHEKHDEECHEKFHEKCHEKHDEECHEKCHEDCHEDCHGKKHDDGPHIINISCKREDDRQHIVNISCNSEDDKQAATSPENNS